MNRSPQSCLSRFSRWPACGWLNRRFYRALRELCDERGIVLIYDEVQTGVGRTGEWFFAGSDGGRWRGAGHHHAGEGARQRHSGGRVSGDREESRRTSKKTISAQHSAAG